MAEGVLRIIVSLGKYATATEIAIREKIHDYRKYAHGISRHLFTVFGLPALDNRVIRVFEVLDNDTGGKVTGAFEIGHRPTLEPKPGGSETTGWFRPRRRFLRQANFGPP